MLTEIDLDAEVSLDIAPPCEYSSHEELASSGDAAYLIRSTCWGCPDSWLFQICQDCYEIAGQCDIGCECGEIGTSDEFWKVVQVL